MNILQQFADFAATKSGAYQTEDNCLCPMAEFGLHKFPEAEFATAGEDLVTTFQVGKRNRIVFPKSFFTKFVETAGTWEELTTRLRRAAK